MFHKKSSEKVPTLEELVLPAAKLKFCAEQLQNLNYIFQKRLLAKQTILNDKNLKLARCVSERLVQRVVCCAGILDPRFSSKFLISCNGHEINSANSLAYILRLDGLSTPRLYPKDPNPRLSVIENDPEYPPGYARIRLRSSSLKTWSDCSNAAGYLRRDKVQAKLVELLAKAVTADFPHSPLAVDESTNCGAPGKIVSAAILNRILQICPDSQAFYGAGGDSPRFPDPRDFRLAILDEPGGIRLKIEFLSPTLANIIMDVKILVGVGVDAWPASTDFPGRVPLGHSDCLLFNQAARTGMFLIGFGVQSSAWQLRLPAAEDDFLNHYSSNSTVRSVLDTLQDCLDEIDSRRNRKKQISYKILNNYMLQTLLLQTLEETSKNPTQNLLEWSPLYLSTHVLTILNQVILNLKAQNLPNYFFKKANLLVNPGHLCEDDYNMEANNVKNLLVRLFDEALMSTKGIPEFRKVLAGQESEVLLLQKWKELIDGLVPFSETKSRLFKGRKKEVAHEDYSPRQLEYLSLILNELLGVKQSVLSDSFGTDDAIQDLNEGTQLEDLIYILVTIMDQARDQYLCQQDSTTAKHLLKIRTKFNSSTSSLIESIRKDKSLQSNFDDDLFLVKTLLKLLHKAAVQDKRYLSPILRPYLTQIFSTSHAISWHLDFIRLCSNHDEIESLGLFSRLVNSSKITPAEGLIDAVNKNWNWAKSILKMVEKGSLRMIFVPDRGVVHRHILSLPSYQQNELETSKTLGSTSKSTTPRNYFSSLLSLKKKWPEFGTKHEVLKICSPMTEVLEAKDRRGDHRGWGDVLKSLQSMQKLSMFEQVTLNLPVEYRGEILELVQELQGKRSMKKYKGKKSGRSEKYTPKEDGVLVGEEASCVEKDRSTGGTLIGSCRAARLREDSGIFFLQDSFKIQSMLNKSDSFKM